MMMVTHILMMMTVLLTCLMFHLTFVDGDDSVISNNNIKCKDPTGVDIDWFIVYKLPKIKESQNPLIRDGLGFSYILPGNVDWTLSPKGINESDSLVGLTLQDLYNKDAHNAPSTTTTTTSNLASIAFITYNDQPPIGSTVDSGGHTKGIIITSPNEGIWLQHSVPHFPLLDKKDLRYMYPNTGLNNGQILHCLSISKIDEVDNIGNILEITKPHVYNFSIPDAIAKDLPILEKIVHKKKPREDATVENHKIIQIQNAGRIVYSFAKGPSFHEEIYSDWISPKYQSELDVQSWLNGPNPFPSNCTLEKLKVYNIEDKEISSNKFSTHNDHAKWAIAIQQPVVCIGDLNRMEHQTKRGGTVNCFNEKTVWKAFKKSVVNTQPCSGPTTTKTFMIETLALKKRYKKMYKNDILSSL